MWLIFTFWLSCELFFINCLQTWFHQIHHTDICASKRVERCPPPPSWDEFLRSEVFVKNWAERRQKSSFEHFFIKKFPTRFKKKTTFVFFQLRFKRDNSMNSNKNGKQDNSKEDTSPFSHYETMKRLSLKHAKNLDKKARIFFPTTFIFFNLVYWTYYWWLRNTHVFWRHNSHHVWTLQMWTKTWTKPEETEN